MVFSLDSKALILLILQLGAKVQLDFLPKSGESNAFVLVFGFCLSDYYVPARERIFTGI